MYGAVPGLFLSWNLMNLSTFSRLSCYVEIICSEQVPFAGTVTVATCLDGNTATDGLVSSSNNLLLHPL